MKRLFLVSVALVGVSVAVVLSGVGGGGLKTFFPLEERNPVTHLRWNEDDAQFQFAIVSDRTGGHRPEVFSQAVGKLNLMQPAFVLSVGDLIEGGAKPAPKIAAEWKEFDSYVNQLTMPFFYVAGNHDAASKQTAAFWEGKLGRRYYHFVYRNVLFLILNSNDPPGKIGIGQQQLAYVTKTLHANASVRWTIVAVHHPIWNGKNNGWGAVETALKGRDYTVFCGHVHRFQKFVRHGMNYYQLATTGGGSRLRGVEFNEFDHFVWVTMKKDGPVLANVLLDSVYPENLQISKTGEKGVSTAKRKKPHPAGGFVYVDGTPAPGALVTFVGDKGPAKGVTASGVVAGDGSFKLTTYIGFDGAPEGEYKVSVAWREAGKSLIPIRYNAADKSGLRAEVKAGMSNRVVLELKN